MMKKNRVKTNGIYGRIILICALALTSCSTSKYYFHETTTGTYTELMLRSNNTFEEYVYLDAGDSLGQDDFGTLLVGDYEHKGDTLLLTYIIEEISAPSLPVSEVYIWKDGNLVKLAPITYSHHFLNMIFTPGKSKQLRSIPNYDSIKWKTNN